VAIKFVASASERVIIAGEITLLRHEQAKRTRLKIIRDRWVGARSLLRTVLLKICVYKRVKVCFLIHRKTDGCHRLLRRAPRRRIGEWRYSSMRS